MIILGRDKFKILVCMNRYFIYKFEFRIEEFIKSRFNENTYCIRCSYHGYCSKEDYKVVDDTIDKIRFNSYLLPSCFMSKIKHESLFLNLMIKKYYEKFYE